MFVREVFIFLGGRPCSRTLIRCFSSDVKTRKINNKICIHTADTVESATTRPLVLMFSWMLAKERHLQKYQDLYLNEGLDVQTIQVDTELLFPRRVQTMIGNVLDTLAADQSNRPLLLHAFSSGVYYVGELLVKLLQNPDKYSTIPPRLNGLIVDSLVDMNGFSMGVSRAVTQNKIGQQIVRSASDMYLKLPNTKHYRRAGVAFKQNAFNVPSLMLYSLNDPFIEPDHIEAISLKWRENGMIANTKFWNEAQHVKIYTRYPDEYTKSIVSFIRECGLENVSEMSQKKGFVDEKAEIRNNIFDNEQQRVVVG